MTEMDKLWYVKLIHTLVWLFFVSAIFYVLFCGIKNRIGTLTWVAIGFVLLEGAVLVAFRMVCPLTIIARRYSDSTLDNFDIFLPNWLAKYNKIIFITLFLISLLIVVVRLNFN